MDSFILTDIEDRTLAMAEDDYVHFKTARSVLGTFYERNVSFGEISSIVDRLSSLGLIRWRILQHGSLHFRKSAPHAVQHNCSAQFTATDAGKAYLQGPRKVA